MSRCVSAVVVIMFALLSSALPVDAQVLTGSIIGTVTDESKSVLPGVNATVASPALPGGPVTGVTDQQGRYRFMALPPGTYTLTLAISGFATYQEEGLRVITGGTIERNLLLKV